MNLAVVVFDSHSPPLFKLLFSIENFSILSPYRKRTDFDRYPPGLLLFGFRYGTTTYSFNGGSLMYRYTHFTILTAHRRFFSLTALIACLLTAPGAYSENNSFQSLARQMLLITPQSRENPADLKIKLPYLENISHPVFSLYSHTGRKILEKPLDPPAMGKIISGDQLFGGDTRLAAGYYFYQIRDSESGSGFFSPDQLYFNDVSQTHLPGDSLPAAFTEFTDVTGDSFPDVILGINTFTSLEQPQIFVNDGSGHFANETAARFPPLQLYVNDVIVFDADSDGDLDIYFAADDASGAVLNADKLLLNDGQGFFSDVSLTHLPQTPAVYQSVDWGLINDDPHPDLLLTSIFGIISPLIETQLTILLNDGSGHFTENASALPQTRYNAFDAALTDVNRDSLPDIVLACLGDFIITDPQGNPIDTLSGRNAVFIQNSNGTFSDETEIRMPDIVRWSKLMEVADINNDGAPELYSIDIGFSVAEALNVLYMNDGSGFFSDETANRLPPETVIWNNDAEFADFDRNGFADLFMINVVPGGPAPDFLYFNSGGFFSDQSSHLPPVIDFNASTAVADMERDDDTDIFISVAPESLGTGLPDLLYENVLPQVSLEPDPFILSEKFTLFQNYPNPFNPSTNIGFRLPAGVSQAGIADFPEGASGFVSLEVFDVTGQKTATLLSRELSSGDYVVQWNGRDDAGREVGSGIYIYRLRAGKHIQSRKMLLIR
jgi:hypothetical protein